MYVSVIKFEVRNQKKKKVEDCVPCTLNLFFILCVFSVCFCSFATSELLLLATCNIFLPSVLPTSPLAG